jgi:hypothetical protein
LRRGRGYGAFVVDDVVVVQSQLLDPPGQLRGALEGQLDEAAAVEKVGRGVAQVERDVRRVAQLQQLLHT